MKIINNLKNKLLRTLKWLKLAKNNFNEPIPVYTKNLDGIKVHLGAGEINLQGWINIDANKKSHTHIIDQDFELNNFSDEALSEVYLCHVLEHFSFNDSAILINKIYKKLKKGGIIRISVPDFEKISEIYNLDRKLQLVKYALMGGQNDKYDFHKSIYDYEVLRNLLKNSNFNNIAIWDHNDFGVKIGDWSEGQYKVGNKKISISLNLKGMKS
tara:strand:+ start:616 stop:1254 length:639 start_codon:yes stop_codon:yes gene_type:complete